jgi:hypothetical protein
MTKVKKPTLTIYDFGLIIGSTVTTPFGIGGIVSVNVESHKVGVITETGFANFNTNEIKPVRRSILDMTDEEAVTAAEIALAYRSIRGQHDFMQKFKVYRYKENGINCIAVIEGKSNFKGYSDDLERLNQNWVEIDGCFSVKVIHNTLCGMGYLSQWLNLRHFDTMGWIEEKLAVRNKKVIKSLKLKS